MATGKTTKRIAPSVPHETHRYLRNPGMIAGYLQDSLEDGDPLFVTMSLRTAAAAIGGMAVLAQRTGLSRETLYRTLSERGNPRLYTLAKLYAAFGLRLSVEPMTEVPERFRTAARKTPKKGKAPARKTVARKTVARKTTARKAARKPKPKPAAPKPARPRR